jgi:hypothetical protein
LIALRAERPVPRRRRPVAAAAGRDGCEGSRQGMWGGEWCENKVKEGRRAGVRRGRMQRGES